LNPDPSEIRSDVLVIGSGIAGLSLALKVAESCSVVILTKKERSESNTNYAQGGIAAVMSPEDSAELHVKDTLECGVGICHEDAVRILVEEGPFRLKELVILGVRFTEDQGLLHLGREGGHSRNRIVHSKDLTGREVERALLQRIAEHPNIQLFENHISIEFITEHHIAGRINNSASIHCWGVYALDVAKNRVCKFLARSTVLCTGGLGQVYLHSTNPPIATGDGCAMAFRAGAVLANMEFIQFHPTTLYDSGSPAFLISEAVRGFGGVLKTTDGTEFMQRYDERGSLAPRDIVARAVDMELKRRGDNYVLLDLRHLPQHSVKDRFPHIYETCLTRYKLDITKEPIPVVPAAHYSCGGVVTDLRGRTSILNLYACGEVAMTGVHGSNRLASNSLLEAIVFSHRAANDILESSKERSNVFPAIPDWDESGTLNSEEWVLVEHDRKEVQRIMWDYVGIVRSDHRLARAERRIKLIRDEVESFYKKTRVTEGLIELRNIALVADLIIRSARLRKESRGLHYTTDFPERDDMNWKKDTLIVETN
jgi:L-aspartate oxidase